MGKSMCSDFEHTGDCQQPENLGAIPNKIYNKASRIEQVSVVKDVKCQRVRNRVRNDESLDARNCLAVQRSAVSFMV